jgi:3-oxoacyl-(acyl-carrier-protein) synthase
MPSRAYITGIGIISAIGLEVKEVIDSLKARKTGISKLSLIDSVYQDEIPVAEINLTNKELRDIAKPEIAGMHSRTALLGLIAARQAVQQACPEPFSLLKSGIISATTVGGMDKTEKFYKPFMSDRDKGRLRDVAGHDCGDSTEKIADCLGIKGFLSTINTACSSSANAIMLGARLIQQGKLDRVIAGGADALSLFTLNGFNSLMILDRLQCQPFDENRNGLNLGEGSAFLVLESERIVEKEGKEVLCELKGFGNACDAYHQTASSPEGQGAYLAMQRALETAGLSAGDISYINAHGTGTKNNDLSEGVAIERVYAAHVPPCSSTKSYTGHTLGAAGAIEAVLSVLAIRHQCIYPNLNFTNQMHELHFEPVRNYTSGVSVVNIMSNSFGFAGNNSSLIFSKY